MHLSLAPPTRGRHTSSDPGTPVRGTPPTIADLVERIKHLLPHGGAVPPELWLRRHQLIIILLYVHALGITCLGIIAGFGIGDSLLRGAIVAGAAIAASLIQGTQRARATIATTGLLVSSALLVHLSGGFIEMHVDFFVLIVIVTLYADWIPFLLAIGYVVAEHLVIAFSDPSMMSDYPDLHIHPGLWILVHGGFILAAALAGLVHWRIDESANVEEALKVRDEEQQAILGEERRAHAKTEVALRARDELLSIVSHDLKDPLGAIKGNAQLLQRHVGGDVGEQEKRVAAGLNLIDVTATRMAELLDELLDVTRLATGNVPELQRHPTDLVALTRRVAADYQKTAARERINVASEYPTLVGAWDSARLERAIANLVLRAILRSPAGGSIDIDLLLEDSAGGADAVVIVRDRPNLAVTEAMAPGIDRFHRVAGTTGRDVGVVVAGQIVEQHGGRIDVTVDEHEWSVIQLSLPVASPNERTSRATSRGT